VIKDIVLSEAYLEMENWLWKDYVTRIVKWQKQAKRFDEPEKVEFT
jgi:hypothetical protein